MNKVAAKWEHKIANRRARRAATGIANTGATSIYVAPDTQVKDYDPNGQPIAVSTASGQHKLSSATFWPPWAAGHRAQQTRDSVLLFHFT